MIIGLSGCATSPMTALERQVRYEQKERSCRNMGGVWYHFGGHSGKCDRDPLFRRSSL